MNSTTPPAHALSGRVSRGLLACCRWLLAALGFLCRALLVTWGALAIHWSNLPWGWLRLVLAVLFAAAGIAAFWVVKSKRGFWGFTSLFLAVLVWWATIRPSHDRNWKPEVSMMPRAIIDGDRVKLTGVRNFEYRSKTDFTVLHEEREVLLSHLQGVDFFVSYWAIGPVAHTFVSFIFDNAPPVCVSIEARLEKGESYSPLASCFKQYELIYVVGDERDIVGVRTNHRSESVFLYHTRAKPEGARRLFLSYLNGINKLADEPEFYHLLRNNCTVNIDRNAHEDGSRSSFDIRLLLNGYVDELLYEKGIIGASGAMPFAELRARSLINAAAETAKQDPDFSKRIREGLPASAE